jgi:hypothetical protein
MIEEAAKLLARSRDFGWSYLDLAFEQVSQNTPQRGRRGEAESCLSCPVKKFLLPEDKRE